MRGQMNSKNRIYGDKIEFASLSCAPVNELGVVYLFGVLHNSLDLEEQMGGGADRVRV